MLKVIEKKITQKYGEEVGMVVTHQPLLLVMMLLTDGVNIKLEIEVKQFLSWVRRRERFMGRHQNNNRLAGVVAAIKWGGVLNMGVPAMKKVICDQKKVVRARRKEAYENLLVKIADEVMLLKLYQFCNL
jgi:hypothetical protein